jgi:hypothetical protein
VKALAVPTPWDLLEKANYNNEQEFTRDAEG